MAPANKSGAAARVARIGKQAAAPQGQEQGEQRRDEPEGGRPVRMTVVLQPVDYDRLQTFVHETQRETGRRGVASSELVRRALDLVLGDDALRQEIVEKVRREGGNQRQEGGKRTRS